MKKVIIVGCGFAGLSAAKILREHIDVELTIIDKRNYHLFQPLLYQVATGELNPGSIASPIRAIMAGYENVKVLQEEVINVDLNNKQVICQNEKLFKYDYLIIACGSLHSYFGNNQWEEYAPGLKTLELAIEIKTRIFSAYEKAEKTTDPVARERLMSFVVVGGGPTGVELAGAISDISRMMKDEFHNIDTSKSKITIVEASGHLLSAFSSTSSLKTKEYMERMGITVLFEKVTNIDAEGVEVNGSKLYASTVIWGAGVSASILGSKIEGMELDRQKRIVVNKDLSVPTHSEVFVVGDQASAKDWKGNNYPGVATVALQQGKCAGKNIIRDIDGNDRWRFVYFNRGHAATIGKSKAVLEFWKIKLHGFPAWVVWLVIHVWFLCGMQNRILVIIQWGWFYLFNHSESRALLEKDWKLFSK